MNIARKHSLQILMLILFFFLVCQGCQPSQTVPTHTPSSESLAAVTLTPSSIPAATFTPTVPITPSGLSEIAPSLPRGRATISNAWKGYDASGFRFNHADIVSWASRQADILASSRDQSSSLIWFFIPNDSPPYQSRYDKGANSGIIEMSQTSLNEIIECPPDGYQFHWIEAKVGGVYCVRTRDGTHYAALQVVNNQENLIFDWVYLSAGGGEESINAALSPAAQIPYTSMAQENLSLYPIIGRNIVLLVPSLELDQTVLAQIVDTFDRAYDFFVHSTGRQPQIYLNYQGKASIAVTPSTCGEVCSYQRMTGIELQADYFEKLYQGVLQYNHYDRPVFDALARNFWFYENEIEYKEGDNRASISSGYVIFMSYLAMEAVGVTPASYGGNDFYRMKEDVQGLLPVYLQYASLTWDNTLRAGAAPPNSSGLGGGDLFASILFDLRNRFGNPFMLWIWKDVDLRPDAKTTQEAVDNFVLAACTATEQNITRLFVDRYRWPVSSAAVKEALTRFGDAIQP